MAATDGEFRDSLSGKSQPEEERRRIDSDVSKTSRSSKHYSRSRSRSLDRKRKSGDRKHRRSHGRSKEARKKDSDKALKSSSDEHPELSDRGCDRLSEDLEERHRRKEKKSSRTRSMSRSHSRERRHQGRHPNKKRSRSRSGEKRSRSHEKKRRARSRSRSKHRHRSRSREKKKAEKARKKSRSRSGSPIVFRGRNTAMDAQEALARRLERAKKLQEQKEKELLEKRQEQAAATPLISDPATPSPAQKVAALLASGTQVTPQIAVAAQMAALHAKTLAETGIAVPSYYNPSAVNPMKFAEQEKKRKMLWQGKKEGDKSQTAELWEKLNFGNKDQNVKFRKLMGIKGEEESACSEVTSEALKTLQQQEEMFRNLDVQYEMARSQTHTQRGTGLGFFSSSSRGMDAV